MHIQFLLLLGSTVAPVAALQLGAGPRLSASRAAAARATVLASTASLAPEQRAGLLLWPESEGVRRVLPGAGAPVPTGGRDAPEGGWWDGSTLGNCVVRRFSDEMQGDRWMLWYSARGADFDPEVVPLATGAVGLAQSKDGLNWERLAGDEVCTSDIQGKQLETP